VLSGEDRASWEGEDGSRDKFVERVCLADEKRGGGGWVGPPVNPGLNVPLNSSVFRKERAKKPPSRRSTRPVSAHADQCNLSKQK